MAEVLEHLGAGVAWDGGAVAIDTRRHVASRPRTSWSAGCAPRSSSWARCWPARSGPRGDARGRQSAPARSTCISRASERMGASFVRARLPRGRDPAHGAHDHARLPERRRDREPADGRGRARTGTTVIDNAAREPEIADLAAMLVAMGARIDGAGTTTIEVEGADGLPGAGTSRPGPDRGRDASPPPRSRPAATSCSTEPAPSTSTWCWRSWRTPAPIIDRARTGSAWPGRRGARRRLRDAALSGFPHRPPADDGHAGRRRGTSIATENVFESRFMFVDELARMGADIRTEGHHAVIRGVERLSAAPGPGAGHPGRRGHGDRRARGRRHDRDLRPAHVDRGYE